MPSLDFLTLYIVVFLHSLTACVVWAALAIRYRPNPAALYWLAGMALTMVGGAVLALQGNAGSLVPAIVGNTIIIVGFAQFWIGSRRFQGQTGGQSFAIGFALLAACVMIAFHDFDRGRAMVYAAGQATVMGLCIFHLLRYRQPGLGSIIAAVAFAVAVLGQLMVIGTNAGVLLEVLEYPIYYALASYALLCTVFSGAVWNLGFALMTIDRLQSTLARLSETDELTGVANRRGLQPNLDRAHRLALQSGQTYSVALFDLDDFKSLNDQYGHAAGDQALAHLGQLLASLTRPTDFVARLGGDEFCLLLADTGFEEAQSIAERLRATIAAAPLAVADTQLKLSVSFGVSTFAASTAVDFDVLREADKALYQDKAEKSRRNGAAGRRIA
ncbi:GGDEF domain-containing protein [Devosia sp. A449]